MSFLAESEPVLTGNYSKPFGLGFECELVERATKAQIIKFLPEVIEKLQEIWDRRDEEFSEYMELSYKKIQIPDVQIENIRVGIENMSLIEAPLEIWPSILIYARNGNAYQVQEDQFDTSNINLCIEILCKEGPIKTELVHKKEGLEVMQLLNSQMQRLTDGIMMCLNKDRTLSGSVGQIEKPPKVITSLPWARKEQGESVTGESYILQGKQLEFTFQKIIL